MLKVKIEFTVEVDPEAWGREYGLDPADKAGIRRDVKRYMEAAAYESPSGALTPVAQGAGER